jgi:hypothetical protein
MQPAAPCALKETLTQRCELAKAFYIQAAERLGRHPTRGFEQAYKEAAEARNAYDAAKNALEAHTKEHGC